MTSRTYPMLSFILTLGLATMATPTFSQSVSEDAASLEEQLAAQLEKNETLRRRIAALEEVLKTDVCSNPDAAKVLRDSATGN